MEVKQADLIKKIREIIKANNLSSQEIRILLREIRSDFKNDRLGKVADQIAILFLAEKLSIEDGARILMTCWEMMDLKSGNSQSF